MTISCKPQYDMIIRNGLIYDGSGGKPYRADIAVQDDKIVMIGNLADYEATEEIDASNLAVCPGFINSLSWAAESLLEDGRSMSDIKQGVTLEVFGEGVSLGPLNPAQLEGDTSLITLGQHLQYMEKKGVSTNIASFVGATTVRIHVLGYDDRQPTAEELKRMKALVNQAMEEGALGVGASLIYPPATYSSTNELIALAEAAATYRGIFIVHLRSEGNKLLEATDELITIAKQANIVAEIYHLKAAGVNNWHKMPILLNKIDSAKAQGISITADMYNYSAASTGLSACVPPWSQDGGDAAWLKRLNDPVIAEKIIKDMENPAADWENFLTLAGKPENIFVLDCKNDSLRKFMGKNLAQVATMMSLSPAKTIVELIRRNGEDLEAAFFLMSDDNILTQIKLPYISFVSDARSIAAEGKNLASSTHPRTYGNFARLLGKYVRDEKVISLEEAIYKLSKLPATKLHLSNRGELAKGYFADIVIFNPATIGDKATYENPHQYAEGVLHVFVNGTQVLKNGEHTGKFPGRFVKRAE